MAVVDSKKLSQYLVYVVIFRRYIKKFEFYIINHSMRSLSVDVVVRGINISHLKKLTKNVKNHKDYGL